MKTTKQPIPTPMNPRRSQSDDLTAQAGFPAIGGYRLEKLEVFNWGCFDGKVHALAPLGKTALLVGENGSGKSTLVDALLTLLVRPHQRSYNIAAGAQRGERDERSYIRGAYDRVLGDDGRPEIRYLRNSAQGYTVLLAAFRDAASDTAFTLAQILHLTADGSVERVYAFARSQRSIVHDLTNLTSSTSIAKQLRDRGFDTTSSYPQYFHWLQQQTGMRSKAMDVFGQTVAVKDVQRLDLFLRQHMLEKQSWEERIEKLVSHFDALSETHRKLKRLRVQTELLRPILEAGNQYIERQTEWTTAKSQLDAMPAYFAMEIDRILSSRCEELKTSIEQFQSELHRKDGELEELRRQQSHLEFSDSKEPNYQLRELELKIQYASESIRWKREAKSGFLQLLNQVDCSETIHSEEDFARVTAKLRRKRTQVLNECESLRTSHQKLLIELELLERNKSQLQAELASIGETNCLLPKPLLAIRDQICKDLGIVTSDAPFAAELIEVLPEEREWQASIEIALRSLARCLLIPQSHYKDMIAWMEATELVDSQGHGLKLSYRVVDASKEIPKRTRDASGLLGKLRLRRHRFSGWLHRELAHHFAFAACDSSDALRDATGPALTQKRHIKRSDGEHIKDDRNPIKDRRWFVLGKDNREAKLAVETLLRDHESTRQQLAQRVSKTEQDLKDATQSLSVLDTALTHTSYAVMDAATQEAEVATWELERQRIESKRKGKHPHPTQKESIASQWQRLQQSRDALLESKGRLEVELQQGMKLLQGARRTLEASKAALDWPETSRSFHAIAKGMQSPLTLENLTTLPSEWIARQRTTVDSLASRVQPAARSLTAAMARYLRSFPEETAEVDPDVASLEYFTAQWRRIEADDLPMHEDRFRARLNEHVLHEIGLFHSSLETDRAEIRDKIDQLNQALRVMQWRPGTTMRLEATDTTDKEIVEFRKELSACLNATQSGKVASNDAAVERIQRLVARLKDPGFERWRDKVNDVRNWFHFAAREVVESTGESRSYYDGGSGQSGGEKGKLAFLILAAAIAYQYDLRPHDENRNRFHLVMVDEMFSRSDDAHAEYALDLFERFGLQLFIVAPLDAKIRVTEPHVGVYVHVIKDRTTHRSSLVTLTAESLAAASEASTEPQP